MTTTAEAPIRERILDAAERLVLEKGFTGTTVDAVLDLAHASKGAFFHHFPTKDDLGRALVSRYAEADEQLLDRLMSTAEAASDDPAEQLVAFVAAFEKEAEVLPVDQPGCLFVSFIYDRLPPNPDFHRVIASSITTWRERVLAKLEAAVAARPPAAAVDLPSLADHVFTVYEGGFILARATDDPTRLRVQLAHLRHYLELLFPRDQRDQARP